ncbi:hypothetical protein AX774_g6728, partial [Zancudomyces culisetae]
MKITTLAGSIALISSHVTGQSAANDVTNCISQKCPNLDNPSCALPCLNLEQLDLGQLSNIIVCIKRCINAGSSGSVDNTCTTGCLAGIQLSTISQQGSGTAAAPNTNTTESLSTTSS